MSKTKIIILVILATFLFAGIIFYKQKIGFWPWKFNIQKEADKQEEQRNSARDLLINKIEKVDRISAMNYLKDHISELSPQKAVVGGSWNVMRFWFVFGSDKDFYVEYEDGHIVRKMLIKINEGGKYNIVGFFEPGEDDWKLISGDDSQYGKPLELYEFDNNLNKWIRK